MNGFFSQKDLCSLYKEHYFNFLKTKKISVELNFYKQCLQVYHYFSDDSFNKLNTEVELKFNKLKGFI